MFSGVRAFWMLNANFGDNLNHYLLKRIADGGVVYSELAEPVQKIVAIGSILNWCDASCNAWGCGLASRSDPVDPEAVISAVRGPISRSRALECGATVPEVYGDPALLLPRIYTPKSGMRYDVGIIPHYVDQSDVYSRYSGASSSIRLIDILDSPEDVIDAIASCDTIISSSLHGIITANAYGIPAAWARFSDKIGGDGMKYLDYFQSVDCDISSPIHCVDASDVSSVVRQASHHFMSSYEVDTDPLVRACPFPNLLAES